MTSHMASWNRPLDNLLTIHSDDHRASAGPGTWRSRLHECTARTTHPTVTSATSTATPPTGAVKSDLVAAALRNGTAGTEILMGIG